MFDVRSESVVVQVRNTAACSVVKERAILHAVTQLQDALVKVLSTPCLEVGKLNFGDSFTTIILLDEGPVVVVGEIEQAEEWLTIAGKSDPLAGLEPWWIDRMNWIAIGWISRGIL